MRRRQAQARQRQSWRRQAAARGRRSCRGCSRRRCSAELPVLPGQDRGRGRGAWQGRRRRLRQGRRRRLRRWRWRSRRRSLRGRRGRRRLLCALTLCGVAVTTRVCNCRLHGRPYQETPRRGRDRPRSYRAMNDRGRILASRPRRGRVRQGSKGVARCPIIVDDRSNRAELMRLATAARAVSASVCLRALFVGWLRCSHGDGVSRGSDSAPHRSDLVQSANAAQP